MRQYLSTVVALLFPLNFASSTFVGPSFLKEPPSRVEFANETGARIDCVASGSPQPTLGWLAGDSEPLVPVPHLLEILSNGSLHFYPFHPSAYRHDLHASIYRCIASNSAGKIISRDVRVRAVVLQYYEMLVQFKETVVRGNTAVLRCSIPAFVKEFITVTSWLQDSSFNIYPSIKGDGKYHMLPNGELLVRRVDETDKYRSYQCRVVNRLTGETLLSVTRARFSVADSRTSTPPRPLEKTSSIVQVRKDQSVVIPCYAESNPPPDFTWYRQEEQQMNSVPEDDDRVFRVGECLIILHADENDSGKWICIANNSAGVERFDYTLQVKSPLSVSIEPSNQVTADVGSHLEFNCVVSGGGTAVTRSWLKDGHTIGPPLVGGIGGQSDSSTLALSKIQREDAGMYQCLVRVDDDSAQNSVQLILGAARPQLIYKFIHQTLQPGPPVSLKCIATGNPTPHINWMLDGFPLPQNDRFVIGQYVTLHGDVISHVNISNVRVEDGGIYQCTAGNRIGSVSHSAQMRVYGLPFVRSMPNVSAIAGEPLYIACPVAGYPIETITWEKDGKKLPVSRRQHIFGNGTLSLEIVQKDLDKGVYRCTASNKQGISASQQLAVNVIVPPKIAPFSFEMDLHLGDRAGAQCFVTKGDLPLVIQWMKDGGEVNSNSMNGMAVGITVRQLGEFTSSLSIESLQPHHAGTYTCSARNRAANATHSSTLLVNVPPRIGPFTFGELIEGVRTQVQCVIQAGDSPLQLKWLKDDREIHAELGIQIKEDSYSSTLLIPHVGRQHTGNYTCLAENAAKSSRLTAGLVVSVPPRWVLEPQDKNISRDETVIFHCQADGFPTPTLVWRKVLGDRMHDYQDLSSPSRSRGVHIFPNGTLVIGQAQPEHEGQYLCEATNGIGAGLSTTVTLVVYVPPEFEVKSAQASVRRGSSQTLKCQSIGDQPITITWLKDESGVQSPVQFNPRYLIKETVTEGGQYLSELQITRTVKSDSGTFVCVATNPFGRAERTVSLQVKDAPGRPHDVRVIDSGSRSVKLTWSPPLGDNDDKNDDNDGVSNDGNDIAPLEYTVQYKQDSADEWQRVGAGSKQMAVLNNLEPASLYTIRVVAENELGAGELSEPVLLRTEGEPPSGPPQNIAAVSTGSDQIKVTWAPPARHHWNGEMLGYNIGFRTHGFSRSGGFNFTSSPPQAVGQTSSILLKGLKKFTRYGIVVQAFNEKGSGPLSNEIFAQTSEDVPSAPPLEIKCSPQSSQIITVNWQPPPQMFINGKLLGYKVYHENMEEWPEGRIEASTKATQELSTSTDLHGLQKYSNYSIQVWAYTKVGDGVKSRPIYCVTSEDVPDAPSGIKVMVSSPSSLIVSWGLPTRPNGRLTSYTVYTRVLKSGRERDSFKKHLPPTETHYEVTDVHKGEAYEFWVTAFTRVGEGQSTKVVYGTASNRVPAAIISFGRKISKLQRSSVKMECLTVGIPPPKRSWFIPDGSQPTGQVFNQMTDGSLEIGEIQRHHQGNYTCLVTNVNGSDQITYDLRVLVAPGAPIVTVSGTGPSWLEFQWTVGDNGGSVIRGMLLNVRRDGNGEWEEKSIPRELKTYRLNELACGVQYNLQMMAYNIVGSGAASSVVTAKTDGGKPEHPLYKDFIRVNVTSIDLNLTSWKDNGCPILSFTIEYREGVDEEWLTVSRDIHPKGNFEIVGLWPGTQYVLKVSATNSAGTTNFRYKTATLPVPSTTGTISPDSVKVASNEDMAVGIFVYLDSEVIIPVIISSVTLVLFVSAGAAATLCLCKRNERNGLRGREGDGQAMVSLSKQHNIPQRDHYYAAVRKGIATPVSQETIHCIERMPQGMKYADDISPYATFHVAGSEKSSASPGRIKSFVYHDTRLDAMETMQLKSGKPNIRDDYTKLRSNPKSSKCHVTGSDYSGSITEWSDHGIANSTIPLQSLMYGCSSVGGIESSTSPEPSPVPDRRSVPPRRLRAHVRNEKNASGSQLETTPLEPLEPPSGFSDARDGRNRHHDVDSLYKYKNSSKIDSGRDKKVYNFTIVV